MSNPGLPDRPALGGQFTKAIRVLVVPTNASSGARVVINTSQLPPIAEILIFNGTNQLITHANTGGVVVSVDDQLSSTAYVAMKVNTTDSANPAFVAHPADSVGGTWAPSLIDQVYQANAGASSEQQVNRWLSTYATPDRTTADRVLVQLKSRSRDAVTHQGEVNIKTEILTFENIDGNPIAITVRPGAATNQPVLHIQSNNTLSQQRAMDLSHAGDAFESWHMNLDGRMQWGPGGNSFGTDTNLFRFGTGVLATDSDFFIDVAGKGLKVREGANAKMGVATLAAGTVVVNTTAVTANSRIFLTAQNTGAGPGALRVSALVAGTSFTVTSTNAADTSTFAWFIVEPS